MTTERENDVAARDRVRGRWALALNLLTPGSGLIVLRQDRRGVALALLFTAGALIGLWGLWIVPGVVPSSVAAVGGMGAVVVWVISQYLVWRRKRLVLGEAAWLHLERCCTLAVEAVSRRRLNVAEAHLREALKLNDEAPHVRVQWAQLMTMLGRFKDARAAWEAVLDVDESGTFRREAVMALDRLPHVDSTSPADRPNDFPEVYR